MSSKDKKLDSLETSRLLGSLEVSKQILWDIADMIHKQLQANPKPMGIMFQKTYTLTTNETVFDSDTIPTLPFFGLTIYNAGPDDVQISTNMPIDNTQPPIEPGSRFILGPYTFPVIEFFKAQCSTQTGAKTGSSTVRVFGSR